MGIIYAANSDTSTHNQYDLLASLQPARESNGEGNAPLTIKFHIDSMYYQTDSNHDDVYMTDYKQCDFDSTDSNIDMYWYASPEDASTNSKTYFDLQSKVCDHCQYATRSTIFTYIAQSGYLCIIFAFFLAMLFIFLKALLKERLEKFCTSIVITALSFYRYLNA